VTGDPGQQKTDKSNLERKIKTTEMTIGKEAAATCKNEK
jgi:hypothetical protein